MTKISLLFQIYQLKTRIILATNKNYTSFNRSQRVLSDDVKIVTYVSNYDVIKVQKYQKRPKIINYAYPYKMQPPSIQNTLYTLLYTLSLFQEARPPRRTSLPAQTSPPMVEDGRMKD
jgi:hypothetical protein